MLTALQNWASKIQIVPHPSSLGLVGRLANPTTPEFRAYEATGPPALPRGALFLWMVEGALVATTDVWFERAALAVHSGVTHLQGGRTLPAARAFCAASEAATHLPATVVERLDAMDTAWLKYVSHVCLVETHRTAIGAMPSSRMRCGLLRSAYNLALACPPGLGDPTGVEISNFLALEVLIASSKLYLDVEPNVPQSVACAARAKELAPVHPEAALSLNKALGVLHALTNSRVYPPYNLAMLPEPVQLPDLMIVEPLAHGDK